eukprot:1159714-Pelagomonas_calceolata.AAC.8
MLFKAGVYSTQEARTDKAGVYSTQEVRTDKLQWGSNLLRDSKCISRCTSSIVIIKACAWKQDETNACGCTKAGQDMLGHTSGRRK